MNKSSTPAYDLTDTKKRDPHSSLPRRRESSGSNHPSFPRRRESSGSDA